MLGSSRIGGIAFLVAVFLYYLGEFLHPRTGEPFPSSPELFGQALQAQYVADNATLWYASHAVLIVATLALMLGLLTLYGVLKGKGERSFSLLAIISVGFFSVLGTLGLLLDGFVKPALAANYLALSGGAHQSAGIIFDYNRLLDVNMIAGGWFSLFVGTGFFGSSMVRTKLYNPALAWGGVILGLGGVIGYIAGIFQPYYIFSSFFLPFLVIFSIWGVVLGIFIYREK